MVRAFYCHLVIGDEMTLNELRARVAVTLERWEVRRDRRAMFLTLYALATDGVHDAVCRDGFRDPLWMLRVVSHLAEHYFITVVPESDDLSRVTPPAWRVAHAAAADPQQCAPAAALLLGLNAHLSNDLPQAIALTLREDWPLTPGQAAGRTHDLEVLGTLLAEAAACALEADRRGTAHGFCAERIVAAWCDDAWVLAHELATTANAMWWTAMCEEIECTALRRAHLIACDMDHAGDLLGLAGDELHRRFPARHDDGCLLGIPAPTWGSALPAFPAEH
ncbi:MAG: hypothetical protein JOZ92_04570 [Candidatus Dormibacteraeota bacterium]|nr:hypothetical protein [Candidatus Dormibacteraeota bacterium]